MQNSEQNKASAIAFYKIAYEGRPKKAAELYIGSEYIQHNPIVGNSIEPFVDKKEWKMNTQKRVLSL